MSLQGHYTLGNYKKVIILKNSNFYSNFCVHYCLTLSLNGCIKAPEYRIVHFLNHEMFSKCVPYMLPRKMILNETCILISVKPDYKTVIFANENLYFVPSIIDRLVFGTFLLCSLKIFTANYQIFVNVKSHHNCVKIVQIWSYFWSAFFCIRSRYRKIQTRKKSNFGHFSRSAGYLTSYWWQCK